MASDKLTWTHQVGNTPLIGAVFYPYCVQCNEPFLKEQGVIAIGKPHFVVVHYHCWSEFDFDGHYKHRLPLKQYIHGRRIPVSESRSLIERDRRL